MNTAPIFSAARAISLETAGSMVEESISSVPFFTFLRTRRGNAHITDPAAPRRTVVKVGVWVEQRKPNT